MLYDPSYQSHSQTRKDKPKSISADPFLAPDRKKIKNKYGLLRNRRRTVEVPERNEETTREAVSRNDIREEVVSGRQPHTKYYMVVGVSVIFALCISLLALILYCSL